MNLREKYENMTDEEKQNLHQAVNLTYHSCAIEGSTLTKNEVFNLLLKEW
jgi:hypothetical protein